MSERSATRIVLTGVGKGFSNLGPVTWLYLTSFFSALPFALGAAAVVDGYFAPSLTAETFAAGVDPVLVAELVLERGEALAVLGPLLLGAAVFWVALSAFIHGAILSAVASDVPFITNELFAAGGRAFGRLMRLLPFGMIFCAVTIGVPGGVLFKLQSKLTEDWTSEVGVFATRAAAVAVTLLFAAWANGAYDLMKAEAVAKGEHRARHAFWRGFVRALKRPLRLLAVYLPFVLFALAVTLVASLVDVRIARTGTSAVIAGFALQQGAAFVRAWASVALAGAEVALLAR